MSESAHIGPDIDADEGVRLDYPPERARVSPLVLGASARLRTGTILYAGSRIGDRFQTGHNVIVREENEIGHDVSVWSNSVVDYGCVIGDGVKIHTNCYVAQYSELGEGAFLAPGVTFANDLYPGQKGSREWMSGPSVGPRAQIGVNATILPFVTIGDGAIIGAGSVVTRDIPAGMVAYGSPAVVVRKVSELEALKERVRPSGRAGQRFRLRGSE